MGNGMTCATTEKHGGAVVAQVAQKTGLRHCATPPPLKGGDGGGANGAAKPVVAQGVASTIAFLREGFGVKDIAIKTGRCVTAIRAEVQALRHEGIIPAEIYGGGQ